MFITGPNVAKAVMQEEVTFEELGGGLMHSRESGVSHFFTRDDQDCLERVRMLLSYLPSNNQHDPPYIAPLDDADHLCPELENLVPTDPHKPYDVQMVIRSVVDALHPGYGFMAEEAYFIRACEAAGITFIGPLADVVEPLCSKVHTLRLAREADFATPQHSTISFGAENYDDIKPAAAALGYPVISKSCSGGREIGA